MPPCRFFRVSSSYGSRNGKPSCAGGKRSGLVPSPRLPSRDVVSSAIYRIGSGRECSHDADHLGTAAGGTDLDADPLDILRWFVRRWSIEVTFAEVRRHLGVETQRQWSDPAIARTTPALLGLFSLITLWAHELHGSQSLAPHTASWYRKALPTFSDALATVRREIWTGHSLQTSSQIQDVDKLSPETVNTLINLVCYAA